MRCGAERSLERCGTDQLLYRVLRGSAAPRTSATRIWEIHQVLVERFIASFDTAPKELVLDFDATDDPVHGKQEGGFFHGYYGHHCFLPLYVFCGSQLLVA